MVLMDKENIERYLLINSKKSVTMNGVINVRGFDEGYVTLETVDGEVTVEGKELKIENLSKDTGEIYISGIISAAYFKEEKETQSVFKRLFK